MKSFHKLILLLFILGITHSACRKDGLDIKDVAFSADKSNIAAGETVTFTIGSGADAQAIYTGDAGKDFSKSRINLVEMKGYSEEQLRTQLYAERIEGLKEFLIVTPVLGALPSNFQYSGPEMVLFEGNLVAWDYSNVTKSKYIRLKLDNDDPVTLTIRPDNAVIPTMLDLDNNKLRGLGALNNVANNIFAPYAAFPDGFDQQAATGLSVKFGVQVVIDGKESGIAYFTQTVRELLDNLNFNIDGLINTWQKDNPSLDPKKGIDEIRLILNADDPTKTDDDGALLNYKGFVYIQQIQLGSADNMIKGFDAGVTIPYVFEGSTQQYSYTYSSAGTYTATLVTTFVGRKQYSDDGYRSGRADEISAGEYPIERIIKTITITVN